jgi:hypothetical protein
MVWQMTHDWPGRRFSTLAILIAVFSLTACTSVAEKPLAQKRFPSAPYAMVALAEAVQANDRQELLAILGPDAQDLIDSGDPVADQNGRTRFSKAYDQRHGLTFKGSGHAVLGVGNKDYPFPIPIVRDSDGWYFDTQAGMDEILDRRIGRNELRTIKVMQAYVAAQREYAGLKRPGGPAFAQKFTSTPGKHDGLYWPSQSGEAESPFGPLIARASRQHYAAALDQDAPEPFHGYYFKILTAQGPHADGGAFDYVANDKMVLGFGLVAYPAKYGASGVMTFIVNQEGVIYEKNLGEDTYMAADMLAYDPDSSWQKYEESTEKPAVKPMGGSSNLRTESGS